MRLLPQIAYEEAVTLPIPAALHFLRVRAVVRPLSEYLRWEFKSYERSALNGQHIVVADLTDEPQDDPLWTSDDFLLFDRYAALVHDYDATGLLRGAWLVEAPDALARYSALATAFMDRSVSFGAFLYSNGNRL